MSRTLFSALVVVCLAVSGFSQDKLQQKLPTPAPAPADATVKPPDYSQEGYVIEKLITSYRFENDGSGEREVKARIRVQSEAALEQWGQLVVGYSSANEKVEIPYVRVLKADGSTVSAPADAVQDLSSPVEREAPMYTDYRQKHITVPGLRPGEVLEYDIVTKIQTPLAAGQFWMEHYFAKTGIVLDEQLQLNIPKERKITLKTQPEVANAKVTDEGMRRTYLWTNSHLEHDADDSSKSNKKKIKKDQDAPSVQMTTFQSWEEVGRWYGGLEKDRRAPTEELRKRAADLTAGKTSDLEKIEALYDFVAKNFRYVSLSFGTGRYQPHSAADVLHNQYGDCKDKHTLLASLLEAAGYHASSVLINAYRKIDADVPSPYQFDHVISLVPLGKDEIWMDTTTEIAPFQLLSPTLRHKQALVVPVSGTPHLEETPANPPMVNTQLQEVDGKVSELGKFTGHVSFTVRGDIELFMRAVFRKVPRAQWQEVVKSVNSRSGLGGEVSEVKVTDPASTKEPFVMSYDVSVGNFLDWSKRKTDLALPVSELTLVDVDTENPGPDNIDLGSPSEFRYRLRLEFPAKYAGRAPVPFSMKRDYGNYEATYKMQGTVFTAERVLSVNVRELPPERTNDYAAFRRAVVADLAQKLAVDSSAAGTPTTSADLKGDDLIDAAKAALDRGNYKMAADLYERAVKADPKNKNAWANLGRTYMAMHLTDSAINAFKQQVELSAYDAYALNALGWAYSTARRYEEAADAYRKAIDIDPLNKYTHAALGGMYAEQKKYADAVPELEKAVSLNADDPLLQIQLGDAYLNLGQDDKAMAAFDHAIDISATPLVWNNIAYQLALRKAHLDRAQQYAESAVSATVAAARNLSLDQLNQRDLGTVQSLAAYWDTLGWVYFAQGDPPKAQKYLEAAWNLGQHSDIGDHLGQVYEKMGRKEDAIRAYAGALAAPRPEPESHEHLAALVGEKKIDQIVSKYRDESSRSRTVYVDNLAKEKGSAEFLLMMSGSGAGVNVEGVKFVSGDDKLKGLADVLRSAKYNVQFPDDSPVKVLRRGIASCSSTGGTCSFVLMLPQDVVSVD